MEASDQRHVLTTGHFTSDCIGGWMVSRTGLDGYGESPPHQNLPDRSACREPQYGLIYLGLQEILR